MATFQPKTLNRWKKTKYGWTFFYGYFTRKCQRYLSRADYDPKTGIMHIYHTLLSEFPINDSRTQKKVKTAIRMFFGTNRFILDTSTSKSHFNDYFFDFDITLIINSMPEEDTMMMLLPILEQCVVKKTENELKIEAFAKLGTLRKKWIEEEETIKAAYNF